MAKFDYSRLRGKMREKGITQLMAAKKIGISETTMTNKLKGRSEFTSGEIWALTLLLDIDDVGAYFFCFKS